MFHVLGVIAVLPWFGNSSIFAVATSAVSTSLVVVAAYITYQKFIRGREFLARADMTQTVKSYRLDEGLTLVQSIVAIKNTGSFTLRPSDGYTLLQRLIPLDETLAAKRAEGKSILGKTQTEIDFPTIERRDYPFAADQLAIDPGESTELYAEFLIPAEVKAINVYSLLALDGDHADVGWEANVSHAIDNAPSN